MTTNYKLSNRKVNYTGLPISSFGQLITASPTPVLQFDDPYGILNNQIVETFTVGANSAVSSSNGVVSITNGGDGAGDLAQLKSRKGLQYRPGQAAQATFTAAFDTALLDADYYQLAGAMNPNDGFAVGINGTSGFGILHRHGGVSETRNYLVDTAADSGANATVTLNGVAYTPIALTNAGGDEDFTAFEIASGDTFGNLWNAQQVGPNVIFQSKSSGPLTGTFSFTEGGSNAAVTISRSKAGVAATDTWIYQSSFNVDKLDGTGPSRMTLDETKLNVYRISYGWLGASNINFSIMNEDTGEFQLFHQISYANQNIVPSISNPQLEMLYYSSGQADQTIKMCSFAFEIIGIDNNASTPIYASAGSRNTVTTLAPIISIKNPEMFNSVTNHTLVQPTQMSLACSTGTAVCTFYVYKNASLGAGTTANYPSWQFVEAAESCVLQDNTSDTLSGGQFVFAYQLAPSSGMTVQLENLISLRPGETMTIAGATSNSATFGVAINWSEQQ